MYCIECGGELLDNAKYCIFCGTPVNYVTPHKPHISWETPPMRPQVAPMTDSAPEQPRVASSAQTGRPAALTMIFACLLLVLVFAFEVVGYLLGMFLHVDEITCAYVFTALGSVLAVVILGGKRLIVPSAGSLMMALKKGWWIVAVSVALMLFDIVACFVVDTSAIVSDWPLRLLNLTILCLSIGISEECMFRGLLLSGLLDLRGKNSRGVFVAVIISSVLFGIAHIDFTSFDFADPLAWLQAFLKVVQTGTYGFFLAALVIRSKDLLGASLLHGLGDFLLLVPSFVFLGDSIDVNYVSSGEEAWATVILYLVIIALFIPLVVRGVRMLKEAPVPERGAFHK